MAFNEMVVGFLEAGTDHISRDIAALDKVDTPVLIAASAYKLFVTQGDSATLAAQADALTYPPAELADGYLFNCGGRLPAKRPFLRDVCVGTLVDIDGAAHFQRTLAQVVQVNMPLITGAALGSALHWLAGSIGNYTTEQDMPAIHFSEDSDSTLVALIVPMLSMPVVLQPDGAQTVRLKVHAENGAAFSENSFWLSSDQRNADKFEATGLVQDTPLNVAGSVDTQAGQFTVCGLGLNETGFSPFLYLTEQGVE